jgi:hypothetical protein
MVQCKRIGIFHGGCGHITQGLIHAPLCISYCEADEGLTGKYESSTTPIPSDIWPHFTVGNCRMCLEAKEKGNSNLDEPARLINPRENPWVMNPGFPSATDIAISAVEWRWRVEEYERDTRGFQLLLEGDKRERYMK